MTWLMPTVKDAQCHEIKNVTADKRTERIRMMKASPEGKLSRSD